MRRILSIAALTLALAAAATSSLAEDFTVKANRTNGLTFYYVYGVDACQYGSKPTFKVLTPPEHGTIFGKWMKLNLTDIPKNCQGRPVYGTGLFYTPNKGYRGKDHATVAFGRTEIPGHVPRSSSTMWVTLDVQ